MQHSSKDREGTDAKGPKEEEWIAKGLRGG
jgi:hypothetical protein